jgi:hypothetical protein
MALFDALSKQRISEHRERNGVYAAPAVEFTAAILLK